MRKIYGSKTKEPVTWIFFILSITSLVVLTLLNPHIQSYYQTDLAKSGKTAFNVFFYGSIYVLVVLVFLSAFAALFYSFLYSFLARVILTDKTIIFREVIKTTEINLKDVTHFAIGRINMPIAYSTGYMPMGSVSNWDYPSLYYKKERKLARLILPWFKMNDFINELGKKAPWVKIKIPRRYLYG